MNSGVGGQIWTLLASSDTVPYGVLAGTVSIGIVLIAGLAALAVKGRSGLPHGLKRHPAPPLPDPVLGRAKRQAQISDRPADYPPSTGSEENSRANGLTPNGVTPEPVAAKVDESAARGPQPEEDVSPGSLDPAQ